MPIQLFGRDQIVVDYERNRHYTNSLDDSLNTRVAVGVRSKIRHWLDEVYRYIYSVGFLRITIVHWVLLVTWIVLLLNFTSVYRKMYNKSALFTTMCTNVLLFGISDILAQCAVCYMSSKMDPIPGFIDSTARNLIDQLQLSSGDHQLHRQNDRGEDDDDDISIFNDYGPSRLQTGMYDPGIEIDPGHHEESGDNSEDGSYKFDVYRWLCFMFWGLFLSFFQVPWYKFLNYFYTEDPTVVQVLERVLSDQLVYSPISLYCFFMYSNYIMEGGDADSFRKKIEKVYISTLGCNYLVWPMVQFVNFLVMPKHFQVPFSSSVGVLWNCFLSMRNASHSI